MNTLVIVRRRLFWVLCGFVALLQVACTPSPSVITYEQIGACNVNEVGAQDGMAFVFFRVLDIDNSKTSAAYTFRPKELWLNTGDLYSGYNYVATGQQASLHGFSPLQAPISVAAGANVAVNKYVVFLVQTTDADGPKEANNTSYFLLYHTPSNEVGKLLIRSNAKQTSWPDTHNCNDIKFPKGLVAPTPKQRGINGG